MIDSYLNHTKETKNFEDIPARGIAFLLKKLHIYRLFTKYAQDGRVRQGLYPIASLLMVALEMLLFRSPSKNEFYQNKQCGRERWYKNLGTIAQLKGDRFPHSKTIDDAFLSLDPSDLVPILFDIFKHLYAAKLFNLHPSLKKYCSYRLGIDALCTHHYHALSQHPCEACPFCLKRTRRTKDGQIKVWYLHIEVVASLIFENGFQMPLCIHRIRKKQEWEGLNEDDLKQECEQTALPFVLATIRAYLPKLKITVLLDGLHANQVSINALKQFHFGWDIVLKRLKSVQEEIDSINLQVRSIASKRFHLNQAACFTNHIPYGHYSLNAIELSEHAQKKPSKRFAKVNSKDVHYQWLVDKIIDKTNLFDKVKEARSRWQEEDLMNSLKNRGFHIKHDYSRHPSCQTIWKILTLIAFCLTSIFLLSDLGVKSRKNATIGFLMRQMLQDLFYFSYETIFLCPYPKQLRFSLWAAAG
jgi:hypothetical protein